MKGLMVLGTASNVGKSLVVTAMCRMLVREGYTVTPFKSQNMAATLTTLPNGNQMSRAQVLQAEACKVVPTVWMNPIVLCPDGLGHSDVILLGKVQEKIAAKNYRDRYYKQGIAAIKQSLNVLREQSDYVVLEGAGSPVEMNLKDRELVNLAAAELADVPAILVADIDRGGIFASIVGTLQLLTEEERNRIKGIVINKFHGDPALFADGCDWLETYTNIPIIGVLPVVDHGLPGEDILSEQLDSTVQGDIYDDLVVKLAGHLDIKRIVDIMDGWDDR